MPLPNVYLIPSPTFNISNSYTGILIFPPKIGHCKHKSYWVNVIMIGDWLSSRSSYVTEANAVRHSMTILAMGGDYEKDH